jgi:acyl-CoA synthetase (AMP-forming)/AMP-acid ligase II/acetyltransferase-like isoleucine patch superfamily enzyme
MCSAIPADLGSDKRPALGSIDGRHPISHTRIRDFILSEFGPILHSFGFGRQHRIALVLPNGPELALAILAIANWASCVPLNALGAKSELEADLQRCGADLVIGPSTIKFDLEPQKKRKPNPFHVLPDKGPPQEFLAFDHVEECANRLGIPFIGLVPSTHEAGIFRLVGSSSAEFTHNARPLSPNRRSLQFEADTAGGTQKPSTPGDEQISRFCPNKHEDEVLVLFTSGTTGNKKIVPHRLGDMLVAAGTIAVSWNLTPQDINCNLMPLFHVGGIVRQVFSPILSGGCVICCPSFDAGLFWALMGRRAFTWYYAAPTMHQIILQTGKELVNDGSETLSHNARPKLRMIANAAGGLLPSLARELRETFGANVLPSYGMTECMPISSPPATYQLEKPGASGVPVGPEVAILNLSSGKELPRGMEGPICVRGEPCFRGYGINYLDSEQNDAACFIEGGWFNTGDLGYMDTDGYLYITGRTKEVINRGGEIISPLEVEDAVVAHPGVKACAAFSTPHSVLQEVVGIVIVPADHRPHLDLLELHEFLGQERLAAPKWPQCLVFMDSLPKSHTNKLVRVKLSQRLGMPEMNDTMYPVERTFVAKCPPQGTSIETAISCERVTVNPQEVEEVLRQNFTNGDFLDTGRQIRVVNHPTRMGSLVCYVFNIDRVQVIQFATQSLHKYLIPNHFCIMLRHADSDRDLAPPKSADAISAILQGLMATGPVDPLVREMQELFQDLLDLDCLPAATSNFFNLGGSSMLASQLASKVRKRHDIPFSGAEVFHHANCEAMARMIQERQRPPGDSSRGGGGESNCGYDFSQDGSSMGSMNVSGMTTTASSFHKNIDTQSAPFHQPRHTKKQSCLGRLIQLLPLLAVFPLWQVTRVFLFFSSLLLAMRKVPGERNLVVFVATVVVFHFLWTLITPLIFVLIKWTVIGRYQKGRYPLFGSYYLRWWFVDVCRKLFGRGIWGSNELMLNAYYRMLGARIGYGARISIEAEIAEFDLVSIGHGASIEYSTVRAFGLDNGSMILGPVKVGDMASVGCRSVVAPFTSLPDNAHLGPVSSSYEIGSSLDSKHLRVNRYALPEPSLFNKLFIGGTITFLVDTVSHIPAFLVLWWMVSMPWHHDEPFDTMSDLMEWLCDPRRIPFYVGIRIVRALVAPFVYMAAAIVVKKVIIGKFQPGPRDTLSQWELMRHWLSATLFSRQNMQGVTELMGRHYECVSQLYRILGAKVGKRVFWPGHHPIFSGEFELLEIGDDVVFGSRSVILCTTADACKKVVLCAGSNVSDNCVVLPGSVIGKNAVLGSTSVCPEDRYLHEGSVYFGARGCEPVCLEKGMEGSGDSTVSFNVNPDRLVMSGDDSTLRPFGKAFYKRQADYWVIPISGIVVFTAIVRILSATLHTVPLISALHATAGILYGYPIYERNYDARQYPSHTVYLWILGFFILVHPIRVFLCFAIEISAKWLFMGRRQEGRYNYDTSPYAQNWEMYQAVTTIRRNSRISFLDYISGTPYIVDFFRLNGCKIGKDCCLYPTGGDPYMPEPDLVEIGDRCAIDSAAVVAHLNTRGNFELAKIRIENHCTLRARSRIQSGVTFEAGSMLLEKSLAMTGEIIESDSVWQGSPASKLFTYQHNQIQPSTSFTAELADLNVPLEGGIV